MSIAIAKQAETLVNMGQIVFAEGPQRLKAVVGSCIALVFHHPRLKKGVMAHIVLPDSAGRSGTPGKFADTAIPEMLALLAQHDIPARGLTVKLAGGANMFASTGPLQIGEANAAAVSKGLGAAGIGIAGQDIGGSRGRRVTFDCDGGIMTIEAAGQTPKSL
jgi:chemotaxis protein CheD